MYMIYICMCAYYICVWSCVCLCVCVCALIFVIIGGTAYFLWNKFAPVWMLESLGINSDSLKSYLYPGDILYIYYLFYDIYICYIFQVSMATWLFAEFVFVLFLR